MIYYPAFLNLAKRRVYLFGGGEVALRKARALARSGADLIAISRDFSKPFLRFAKHRRIQLRTGSRIPKLFRPAALVIAATSDRAFNHEIYKRSSEQGILVNVVDDPTHSTFMVPSVLRRGSFQIAITTGGASPLLAKMLRKKLAREFGAEYGLLIRNLKRDREKIKRLIPAGTERRNHFRKLITSRLKELNRDGS